MNKKLIMQNIHSATKQPYFLFNDNINEKSIKQNLQQISKESSKNSSLQNKLNENLIRNTRNRRSDTYIPIKLYPQRIPNHIVNPNPYLEIYHPASAMADEREIAKFTACTNVSAFIVWQFAKAGTQNFQNLENGNGITGAHSTTLKVRANMNRDGDRFRALFFVNDSEIARTDSVKLSVNPVKSEGVLEILKRFFMNLFKFRN